MGDMKYLSDSMTFQLSNKDNFEPNELTRPDIMLVEKPVLLTNPIPSNYSSIDKRTKARRIYPEKFSNNETEGEESDDDISTPMVQKMTKDDDTTNFTNNSHNPRIERIKHGINKLSVTPKKLTFDDRNITAQFINKNL
ncbi:uncharacterized protein SPAPADRAFT_59314, partial [Spathaspora passalidarum NRRL Y-27907]